MFWHESQENDINIFPYNKSDFLKLSSAQSYKEKEKNSNNMIDLSDDFKIDTIVSTAWDPEKAYEMKLKEEKMKKYKRELDEQIRTRPQEAYGRINNDRRIEVPPDPCK